MEGKALHFHSVPLCFLCNRDWEGEMYRGGGRGSGNYKDSLLCLTCEEGNYRKPQKPQDMRCY